ncbi:hypothetical protein [Nonomuraea sp. NPDC050786]|uniref:hypothetical protein n=1 Tax=Nonomuraea sp. NPDC050786 TaxID=3154840 RepID=UPI0033DF47F6
MAVAGCRARSGPSPESPAAAPAASTIRPSSGQAARPGSRQSTATASGHGSQDHSVPMRRNGSA